MILDLIPDHDPALHTRVPDHDFFEQATYEGMFDHLVKSMFATMEHYQGIGLAANQCGIMTRMFVMDVDGVRMACFNPIVDAADDDTVLMQEGCLSYPGLFLKIKRAEKIRFRYQTETGSHQSINLAGLPARVVLHETDHLNGIVFTDRVSKLKLDMARKRATR